MLARNRNIGPEHAEWLEQTRKIPIEVAAEAGLFSLGDAIGFPFADASGAERYNKLRTPDKRISRDRSGVPSIPWGLDRIAEALGTGDTLVITEGEFDALSARVGGAAWAISVPDGAKAAEKSDVQPSEDSTYAWLWTPDGKLLPEVDKFSRIILAVDDDDKGRILGHDLAVRLGRARCWFVRYPAGCKDLNDVLIKHDEDAVATVLESAKPLVPSRLTRFGDIPATPNPVSYSTGWSDLDYHMRFRAPELAVILGPPGAGKSQFALALVAQLARIHDMKSAIVQFEDDVERNRDDLRRYASAWETANVKPIVEDPDDWIDRMFVTLSPDEGEEDERDLAWLKRIVFEAAKRHGCRCVLLDPWNEISHMWDRQETETVYTRRALSTIKRWARALQIIVMIVVHPTKAAGAEKHVDDWSLYDAEASNSWNNKADHGVIVWRESSESAETYIKVSKSKDYRRMGIPGTVVMDWDSGRGIFAFNRRHRPDGGAR